MNWRLGFLRLWVAFSVLWLAGCGVWVLFQSNGGISARYPVTDPGGLRFIVTAPVGTAKSDILPFMRKSAAVRKWQADCGNERSDLCRQEIPVRMPGVLLNIVQFLVLATCVPPLVLVLGLISGWVISGFQKPVTPKS